MTQYNTREFRRKLYKVLLVIEFAMVLTAVIVAFGQGWPAIMQPLQVLGFLIVMTIISMIFQEVCTTYENEVEQHHHGTYHEFKT